MGLGDIITAILGSSVLVKFIELAQDWWRNRQSKKVSAKGLDKNNEKSILIKNELTAIKKMFGFDFAPILSFHNGVSTVGGYSFKKVSIYWESSPVVLMNEIKDVPSTVAAELWKELAESTEGYVTIDDQCSIDDIALFLKMYDIKQAVLFRVGDTLVDGCVFVGYKDKERECRSFEHNELLSIKAKVKKINLILNR